MRQPACRYSRSRAALAAQLSAKGVSRTNHRRRGGTCSMKPRVPARSALASRPRPLWEATRIDYVDRADELDGSQRSVPSLDVTIIVAKMTSLPSCRKCGRRIEANAANAGIFEGMHWLCFHLEYEHDADPDIACGDYAGCPWWTIDHLKEKLKDLAESARSVT
jgi:hypothetical protein